MKLTKDQVKLIRVGESIATVQLVLF